MPAVTPSVWVRIVSARLDVPMVPLRSRFFDSRKTLLSRIAVSLNQTSTRSLKKLHAGVGPASTSAASAARASRLPEGPVAGEENPGSENRIGGGVGDDGDQEAAAAHVEPGV